MFHRFKQRTFKCLWLLVLAAFVAEAAAAGEGSTVASFIAPRVVIYPGDLIDGGALMEARDDGRYASMEIIRDKSAVEGRVARKTLLPGMPISSNSLAMRRAVRNGGEVRLVFSDGDLTIVTFGEAMQDGSVGDMIKCRNGTSGLTVSGVIQSDGTVRVRG